MQNSLSIFLISSTSKYVSGKYNEFIGVVLQEALGHVDINLHDVVNNGRINEKYHLVKSKYGIIHVEIQWKIICL